MQKGTKKIKVNLKFELRNFCVCTWKWKWRTKHWIDEFE